MARDRSKPAHPKTDPVKALGWYGSNNESVEGVVDWDIKAQTLGEAILSVLAAGQAIQFGTSWDGDCVFITIYEDGGRRRKAVTDCIEFDDAIGALWQQHRKPAKVRHINGEENAAD